MLLEAVSENVCVGETLRAFVDDIGVVVRDVHTHTDANTD